MMKTEAAKDLNRIFIEDGQLIDEALKKGVLEAIQRHKQAGLPIAIYRDGKTVWIDPDQIDA
jgi:hypothetical protein